MKKPPSINTLLLKNIIRAGRLTILLAVGIALILFAYRSTIDAQNEANDLSNNATSSDRLAYVSDEGHLILYNPHDRTETTLLENVNRFVIGQDGRIAFTKLDETDTDLYVFDPSTPALAPINISHNPAANTYPLAWSPDGRYVAFGSYQDSEDLSLEAQSLYVWDGENATNIMPDNGLDSAVRFYVDWSHDGRLAFMILYGWSNLDKPAEIYLWDGDTTTSLSQNPEGHDGAASWSMTGQLMFVSYRDEESGIYVWDGMSFRDGSPDIETFIRLPSELQPTHITWTDEGFVALTVYTADRDAKEIILWNLKRETIVRRIPVSSDNASSWLAEGGQVILSSHLASGTPTYYLDVENTEGEMLFSTVTGEFAWSSDGYLAYCGRDKAGNWILSLWSGGEPWVVASVRYRPVQWQNGRDTFSCNNG